jgi:hypothetical protein
MKTFEFDVATDTAPLETTIENIYKIDGVIMVQVLSEENDANGWPTIKVTINESESSLAQLGEIFPDYEDEEIK